MANFTVKVCYPNWLKIASIVCHVVLYSSRTERLLTRQSWIETGLPPTAVTSSEKTNGHRTHQTSTLLTVMSEELCVNAIQYISTQANTIDELKKVLQSTRDDLPQNSINKAILNIVKKTSSLCESWGRTF